MARRTFKLDSHMLVQARASRVLALEPAALGSIMALSESSPSSGASGPGVAVVSVEGPLEQRASEYLCGFADGYDAISARFAAAHADPEVGAVVLRIDSPGGDLAGLEEGVRRMRQAAEQSGKRTLVYVDELAASAAYWIASAVGDEIVVPPAGGVGSIGTLAWYTDETSALESEGVQLRIFRDPPGKAAMHPGGPVTDVADERIGRLVSEATTRFVEAVSGYRGESALALRSLNGAVAYGAEAVSAGLADRVGTYEETIEAARTAVRERDEKMTQEQAAKELAEQLGETEASAADMMTMAAVRLAELAPEAELGRKVLEMTSAAKPAEAIGAIAAWQQSHQRAEQERAELAAERKAHEQRERVDLLAQLITAGYETPATAWADPVAAADPDKRVPHPDHMNTPIEALRRRASILLKSPRPHGGTSSEAPANTRVPRLTETQLSKCKAQGWDPDEYAQRLQATRERTYQIEEN